MRRTHGTRQYNAARAFRSTPYNTRHTASQTPRVTSTPVSSPQSAPTTFCCDICENSRPTDEKTTRPECAPECQAQHPLCRSCDHNIAQTVRNSRAGGRAKCPWCRVPRGDLFPAAADDSAAGVTPFSLDLVFTVSRSSTLGSEQQQQPQDAATQATQTMQAMHVMQAVQAAGSAESPVDALVRVINQHGGSMLFVVAPPMRTSPMGPTG